MRHKRLLTTLVSAGLLLTSCSGDDAGFDGSSSSPTRIASPVAPAPASTIAGSSGTVGSSRPSAGGPAVNPWITTVNDPQSTFAMDVDTGSYTIARAALLRDQLPEARLVRPEEFVNYFEQGYKRPTDNGFGISIDGTTNPFEAASTRRTVRVGLSTRPSAVAARQPANVTLVVDVSGSMGDAGKMELVKKSMRLFIDELRADDTIAIVTYSDNAKVVLQPTPARERARIYDVIENFRPDSSTNIEAGLSLGYRTARSMNNEGRINKVILASDGIANVGQTTADGILRSVREEAAKGVQLLTVGYGFGQLNDPMMERLADGGNGWYVYVDDELEARRVFVDRFTSTLDVAALDGKVQVEFDSTKVRQYRLMGFENRAVADGDFRNNTIDAGEVGAGHSVTALYEIELTEAGRSGSLGTVRVRWTDAKTRQIAETHKEIEAAAISTNFSEAPARLQHAVVVGWTAEVFRNSPHATGVSLKQLAAKESDVARRLDDKDVTEFSALLARAALLTR